MVELKLHMNSVNEEQQNCRLQCENVCQSSNPPALLQAGLYWSKRGLYRIEVTAVTSGLTKVQVFSRIKVLVIKVNHHGNWY